jgi:hypothetical protein
MTVSPNESRRRSAGETISRDRVIPVSKHTQLKSNPDHDQTTIPDFRTGGTVPPQSQFKKSPNDRAMIERRRKLAKHYPLKNGLPYIPSYSKYKNGVINLFNPNVPTLEFAEKNIKEPEDSLLRVHRLGSQLKTVEKLKIDRTEGVEDMMKKLIYKTDDDIGAREMFFLADRVHDTQGHRNKRLKYGMVHENPFESTQKILSMLKDLAVKQERSPGSFA